MFDDDPRWGSDPRERDDDVRGKEIHNPRDAFVKQLDLPGGYERELSVTASTRFALPNR